MTPHQCPDLLCSHRALSKAERDRLYPTDLAMSQHMVENHFEVQATEAQFRALFDQFIRREVA